MLRPLAPGRCKRLNMRGAPSVTLSCKRGGDESKGELGELMSKDRRETHVEVARDFVQIAAFHKEVA